MNRIESLFNQEKYEEVIALSNDSKDTDELYFRALSFYKLHNFIDFQNLTHLHLYDFLVKGDEYFLNIYIKSFLINKDYVKALEVIEEIRELPYISISLLDTLMNLKKLIYAKMKDKDKNPMEVIEVGLNSSEDKLRYKAISALAKNRLTPAYRNKLEEILLADEWDSSLKKLILLAMFEDENNQGFVKINYQDKILEINLTSKLNPNLPNSYLETVLKINRKEMQDVGVCNINEELIKRYFYLHFLEEDLLEENELYNYINYISRSLFSLKNEKMDEEQLKIIEKLKEELLS